MSTSEIFLLLGSVVLLGIVAVFAAAETSFTRMSRARAEALNDEGDDGPTDAGLLRRLVDDRTRVVTPVVFVQVFCLLAIATIIAVLTSQRWGSTGVIFAFVIEFAVVYVLGVGLPKAQALADPDRSATRLAGLIGRVCTSPMLRWVAVPVIALVRAGDAADDDTGVAVSEEELLALAELAAVDQAIDIEEQELIESTIAFGDTTAREVMVPRPDMMTVPAHLAAGDVMELIVSHGFSRLPVTGAGIDDIVGIVHAKHLMAAMLDDLSAEPVETLMREAHVVPETKHINKLMREMQAETFHLAIVVDEYGGTAGLVSLEDLIEELVGEIVDEFDVEEPMIEALGADVVRVNGKASLSSLEELLGARLPDGDWSTVGGLIFNTLGHVPETGETLEVGGHLLIVERVQGRRIARVRIETTNARVSS